MAKIIFLNGCSSSGKSSIAKAIGHESQELWLTFGVDTFIDMIPFCKMDPYLNFIPGQNEHGPTMSVESGPEGVKLFSLMSKFAQMLADNGQNIIIDEVLLDADSLKLYVQQLKGHTVYYVGVFCELKTMQEREILRGDRCVGLSNDQIGRVHQGALNVYDFKVDTTATSPFEAARLILMYVDNNPSPGGLIEEPENF